MAVNDGTLSIGERFTRLETLLEGIDKKLDNKTDVREHERLSMRVDGLFNDFTDIRMHGSENQRRTAADFAKFKTDSENRLTQLETEWRDFQLAEDIQSSHAATTWTFKRRVWAVVGAVSMMLVTFWGPYAATHLHF